jgi:hypothetical protein
MIYDTFYYEIYIINISIIYLFTFSHLLLLSFLAYPTGGQVFSQVL